jgi:hypothetical protein
MFDWFFWSGAASRHDAPVRAHVVSERAGSVLFQSSQHVIELIESLGLRSHVIVGTERTVIAAVGDDV